MPAGVSWSQYLKVTTAAMLSMLAGAQVVHTIYRPLKDFDKFVEQEKDVLRRKIEQEKLDKAECPIKHN